MSNEPSIEPSEHHFYEMVLRMVLWGDDRGKILERLGYNGVEGEEAEALFLAARSERISTIRGDYWRKFWLGFGLIFVAVSTFSICWYTLGFVYGKLVGLCILCSGVGLWKFIDGLAGVLMAPGMQGPLKDEV